MGIKAGILFVSGVLLAILLYSLFLFGPPHIPNIQDGWYGKGKIISEDDPAIRDFKVNITDEVLADLKHRLKNSRATHQLEDTAFHYGFPSSYLKKVIEHWKNDYDWRKHEAILNSFQQYLTQIEGIDVHFLRVAPLAGVRPGKKPLMIIHGWPGSVWEFYKLIPRLTEPEKFGGQVEDAVEVICPSIPGYGFSEKPHQKGFGPVSAARVFVKLMKRLGYEEFYVQGGDWGSVITVIMAQVYPSNVNGIHLNLVGPPVLNPKMMMVHQFLAAVAPSFIFDENDKKRLAKMNGYGLMIRESGYMHIQATRPDTVGKGLSDSPAGLAAYILEKFSVWTDPTFLDLEDGGLTKKFTLDELLTNVMIYWVTDTITSSMRFYREFFYDENAAELEKIPVTVPTGIADFPKEVAGVPKAFLWYKYKNIVQYSDMHDGGHFAAFEQPDFLANDIFLFLRKMNRQ